MVAGSWIYFSCFTRTALAPSVAFHLGFLVASIPLKSSLPRLSDTQGHFAEAAAHDGSMTQSNIFLIWQCGLVVCTGTVHIGSQAFYFWG